MSNSNFYTFELKQLDIPIFSEAGRSAWINYGEDNLYPNFLVQLMNSSSKHNALLKRKTDMCAGNGWVETTENETFIKNEFGSENLNKIAFKNAYDLNIYGAFTLLITWSKGTGGEKTIARIKYIDLSKIRISKAVIEKDDAERFKRQEEGVEFYYISSNWSNTRKIKPELIQGFSEKYNDVVTQLIYTKEYRPGTEYYVVPDYISAQQYILLDSEIANYHLHSAVNGFTPSLMINFIDNPSDDEKRENHRKIQDKFAGTSNASKLFLTYSESVEKIPQISPINNNDNDTRFIELEEQISNNIAQAHRINPSLIVPVAGRLGGGTELFEGFQQFQKTVINQKQFIIEETYNLLAEINGVGEMELIKSEPIKPFTIETEIDISEMDIEQIDEIKEQIEEIEEEKITDRNNGE